MKTVIWWIRRDLRLTDNQALHAALQAADAVVPLFILDDNILNSAYVGDKQVAFMFAGLQTLAEDLEKLGSALILRRGDPPVELMKVVAETGASAVYAERANSPYAKTRDEAVAAMVDLHLTAGVSIQAPWEVLKKDNTPYTVFTPYKKRWYALLKPEHRAVLPAPDRVPAPAEMPESLMLPSAPELAQPLRYVAGEAAAQAMLRDFVSRTTQGVPALVQYDDQRDFPSIDGTSSLSGHLRFGMLSVRQAANAALDIIQQPQLSKVQRDNASVWVSELIWRDFYMSILHHFPHVYAGNFRADYDKIDWRNDEAEYQAWCEGRTGYPIVDAAMRQLVQTGWMHNRARMIVASFLVKDLLIDWRWGEKFFMQHLIDGDPAANNGGWQWAAGTGTDAAPYFRIFNPMSQSKKFDANGDYIRQYVPELAKVPKKYIHAPWEMPPLEQTLAKCQIGQDYPKPIVDHKMARERTLAAYKASKEAMKAN